MKSYRKMLRAKIHRAVVTGADLDYEGSVTIPPELLSASDIRAYEAVSVWNITQGTRFETYAISGVKASTDICVNGAAACLANVGDKIIIASFTNIKESHVEKHKPKLVFVDENNRQIHDIDSEIPGPQKRVAGMS